MTKEEVFSSSPTFKESVLASSHKDVQNPLVTAANFIKNENQHYRSGKAMHFMETISTHCSEVDTLNETVYMTDRNENKTGDSNNGQDLQFAECRYMDTQDAQYVDYRNTNRVDHRDKIVNSQFNINAQLLKKITLGNNLHPFPNGKSAKLMYKDAGGGSNLKHSSGNVYQHKANLGHGYQGKAYGSSYKHKGKSMQDLEFFRSADEDTDTCQPTDFHSSKNLSLGDAASFHKPLDALRHSGQVTSAHDKSEKYSKDTTFTRLRNVHYWYRPFAMTHPKSPSIYFGLPVLESVTGNVQKSWHLEAIKTLDRTLYSLLKMVMLRLSNDKTNIHPKRLFIRCKGSWDSIQEGSFGTVYVGSIQGKGYSAVKIPNIAMLNHDPIGVMKRFINEWDILSRCKHQNIVSLHGGIILGVFDIWLCTELVQGVDLHSIKYGSNLPRPIPVSAAIKMCRQLADVLLYLHTSRPEKGIIIHRDIKPENIIVDSEWNIKLCDFGDASETNDGIVNNVSGATWLYAPPELLLHPTIKNDLVGLQGTPSYMYNSVEYPPNVLSEKWDVWSAGCVFQEMFGYVGPFHHLVEVDDSPNIVCEKMVKNAMYGLVPNIPKFLVNTKLGNLISQCLDLNPKNRPSALTIYKVLQSPDLLEGN